MQGTALPPIPSFLPTYTPRHQCRVRRADVILLEKKKNGSLVGRKREDRMEADGDAGMRRRLFFSARVRRWLAPHFPDQDGGEA